MKLSIFRRPQRVRLLVLPFTVIKRAGPLVIDTKIDLTLVRDVYAEFCLLFQRVCVIRGF